MRSLFRRSSIFSFSKPSMRIFSIISRSFSLFFPPFLSQSFCHSPRFFLSKPKEWEEWQKDWQKNWEEQSEKLRDMIEKMRIDGFEKLKIEDLQNRLRIEIPRIEIQLKDLEDKIRIGYGFDRIAPVEGQLQAQLAAVEAQLAALRARYSDTDPKTSEM